MSYKLLIPQDDVARLFRKLAGILKDKSDLDYHREYSIGKSKFTPKREKYLDEFNVNKFIKEEFEKLKNKKYNK